MRHVPAQTRFTQLLWETECLLCLKGTFLTIRGATSLKRRILAPCFSPFPHQVRHCILVHSINQFCFPKTRKTPSEPKETRTQGGFNDGTFLSPLTSCYILSPETSNKGDLVLADFALKSLNCNREEAMNLELHSAEP